MVGVSALRGAATATTVLALVGALMTAGTGTARADAPPPSDATWRWLVGQLGTGTQPTTSSVITPAESYPASWTGPVSGRVELDGLPAGTDPSTLEVAAIVVTDTEYPIATTALQPDGGFSFPWSHPGTKLFRLLDPATGQVLAEHAPDLGLVRSYDVPVGHPMRGRTFSYDQALALVTALSFGEDALADRLAAGLLRLQTAGGPQDGGFITSAAALNPAGGPAEYRTGNHGVATYALLRYLRDGAPDTAARAAAVDGAQRAVSWLLAQQAVDGPLAGLVRGGHGAWGGGGFDPGAALPWASTEHNVDAWHTLGLAGEVLGRADALAARDVLEQAVMDRLWSSEEGRFWQGRSPEGPDQGHALDVSSWGAIFLAATGRQAQAEQALADLGWYASSADGGSGYAPVPFPSAPLVWTEGTSGVALAQLRVGRPADAAATMAALAPVATQGVYPGATRDDDWLSMTSLPAVGAATWVLLTEQALAGRPSIWDIDERSQP